MSKNRIFPKYDGEEQHEFSLPNGPTIAVQRKAGRPESHLAAVLASPDEEDPPHLLGLTAERIEDGPGKGYFLHSIEHLDHPTALAKLRVATVNGETRIYIRVGGPESEELMFVTLEQLEWLIREHGQGGE